MSWTVNTNIINDTNQYLLDAKNVKGTFVVVASTAERDALPAATTVSGSLCYCTADSKFYQYNGSSWQEKEFGTNATSDANKLYLVGAKDQTSNPQTYSNSNVYMTNGALTTNSLKTARLYPEDQDFFIQKDNNNIAVFHSSAAANGETWEVLTDHLIVWGQNDSNNLFKPTNQTGFSDLDTYYFNTGIALQNAVDLTTHRLSFPSKSGTLSTIKYKHNIVLSGSFSGGPGGSAYCTFSFINDGPSAISNLSELNTALAARFTDKICPACGLFGYNSGSSASLYLITGITYDTTTSPAATRICYNQIAGTSSNTMTVTATPNSSPSRHQYQFSSATVIDTIEEC